MSEQQTVVVETMAGRVAGQDLGGVLRFRGIPYGADTSGRNRFAPPALPEPWTGIREAFEPGDITPQFGRNSYGGRQSENCLVANVWTPSTSGDRPILFWVHGGGFFNGRSDTPTSDGERLAREHDVVIVSVNHRLALLGFLDLEGLLGDEFEGSANASMLDLVAALRWTKANAESFGGNPEAITIFGHSGGGGKVATLMSMPEARGLFRSAVVHGGPPFGLKDRGSTVRSAEEAVRAAGLTAATARELRELPLQRLMDVQAALGVGSDPSPDTMRFSPVAGTAQLPLEPYAAFASGLAADVDLMAGTAKDEARFVMFARPDVASEEYDLTDAELAARVATGLDEPDLAQELIAAYRERDRTRRNADLMFEILSDQFRIRTLRLLDAKVSGGGSGRGPFLYSCTLDHDSRTGSYHGIEMPLFFGTLSSKPGLEGRPEVEALSAEASSALVSFARRGGPVRTSGGLTWGPFGPASDLQLELASSGASVGSTADDALREDWRGFAATSATDPWSLLFS